MFEYPSQENGKLSQYQVVAQITPSEAPAPRPGVALFRSGGRVDQFAVLDLASLGFSMESRSSKL